MSAVAVVGMGYVGMPIAIRAVEAGHDVIGVDVGEARLQSLREGMSYTEDVSDERLLEAWRSERFHVQNTAESVEFDIALITVPTPVNARKQPDLSYIESAAEYVGRGLRPGGVVVLESTTYPGTTEDVVAEILERESGLCRGEYLLGYSPERINPGDAVNTFDKVPKIVSGVGENALNVISDFYATLVDQVVPVSSPRAAELAKVFENTFASVNIALVNEMAMVCSELGLDVDEVLDAAATKGHAIMRFRPGPGVGGHSALPGTLVMTEHGIRPIESIKVGDRVVASDGRLHPVLKAWSHDYDGEAVTIRARGLLPVTMTAEHRIPVASDGRPSKRGRKHHPVAGKTTVELLGDIEVKHIRDVVPGTDFVYWPLIAGNEDVDVPTHVSDEYVKLAGWFLSEGTLSGKKYANGTWVPTRIGFGFHVDEVDYHAEVSELVEMVGSKYARAFNASGVRMEMDYEHHRGNVFYGSRLLAEQLIEDFGHLQHDRSLPSWLLFGPDAWVPMVLRGLLCGDGMLRGSEMVFGTTSEALAYDVMILLNRLDIHATIRTQQQVDRRRAWYVTVRGSSTLERLYGLIGEVDVVGELVPENIHYPTRDNKVFRTVQSVEFTEYVGPVYDLTIDEDHTFLTNGALQQNCIAVDPLYLSWMRRNHYGSPFEFAELADRINGQMPEHVVRRVRDVLAEHGVRPWKASVLALGVAYKPGVADVRESPAIAVIEKLQEQGVEVIAADPHVHGMEHVELATRFAGECDLVVVLTDHREFEYEKILGAAPAILDTRNVYPRDTQGVYKL